MSSSLTSPDNKRPPRAAAAAAPASGGGGSNRQQQAASSSSSAVPVTTLFPVGASAKSKLRKALTKRGPAAIAPFQREHSLDSMMARAFGTRVSQRDDAADDEDADNETNNKPRSSSRIRANNDNDNNNNNNNDAKKNMQLQESLDTDPVMTFLSHLGVSRYDVHKRISDTLLKQLEDEIRKTQAKEPLKQLLASCWSYATTVPELRPILWGILRKLGESTPKPVLDKLAEREKTVDDTSGGRNGVQKKEKKSSQQLKHAEIFRPLPPLLKRLVWEGDWDKIMSAPDSHTATSPAAFLERTKSTLLYETLHPLIDQYCTNNKLVDAANRPFASTVRERKMMTTHRRALTASTASNPGTATGTASLLRAAGGAATSTSTTSTATGSSSTSGMAVAQIRSLLCDRVGSSSSYRPKLLYALLSILMAQHGLSKMESLASASQLCCTLVADILLSAGGPLPKAYQHVLSLAQALDECVQEGNISDAALVKIQDSLRKIFQPDLDDQAASSSQQTNKKNKKSAKTDGSSSSAKHEETLSNSLKRQLDIIISAGLSAMKEADPQNLFLNPVTDSIAPGYSKIIKKPVCISSMQQKMDDDEYLNLDGWEVDVKLMFKNCKDYNKGVAGQWFRGEANRQDKIFRDEILPQARRLYQVEVAKRSVMKIDDTENRKRKARDSAPQIIPLEHSSKKRKKETSPQHLPSMPALASMLLSDPFVVRIIMARALRELRIGVLGGTSLPSLHFVIPSLLQVLHMVRCSSQLCATRGRKYSVPGSGLADDEVDDENEEQRDPFVFIPYASLRRYVPLLLTLQMESELDRRMAHGGDLNEAAAESPSLLPQTLDQASWIGENGGNTHLQPQLQVVVSVIEGALVHLCLPGNASETSLAVSFPKFALALESLSASLWQDRVFFTSLIDALMRHRSKLEKTARDTVCRSWLAWLKRDRKDQESGGSCATAAHECFILLLNEWSTLGNLVLPRDTLLCLAKEAVETVNSSENNPKNKFAALWSVDGASQGAFAPVRKQYERMLKKLPQTQAKEWRKNVGIVEPSAGDTATTAKTTTTGTEDAMDVDESH